MSWRVLSTRMSFPTGSVVSEDDLVGCNIPALVATGHLAPVKAKDIPPAKEPEDDDTAEKPEEQD